MFHVGPSLGFEMVHSGVVCSVEPGGNKLIYG